MIKDSHTKRFVYPLWLRFFTLAAAIAAFFMLVGPSSLSVNSDPSLPWNEQKRTMSAGKTVILRPSDEQAQLAGALRYKTAVQLEGEERGDINFLIYPEGIIRGVWNGEYDRDNDVHCVIMAASFIGNINPSKRYVNDGTADPSKLYFTTAGSATMMETNSATGHNRSILAYVYVRGWINSDYSASGELILTRNKKTYESFSWDAAPIN